MLINLRNALMAGKRLPYDAEVEFLESTGTQWIDTGVKKTTATTIDCLFSLTDTALSAVFGERTHQFNTDRCVLFNLGTSFRFDANSQKSLNIAPNTTSIFRFQFDGSNAIITDTTTGSVVSSAVDIGNGGIMDIALFANNTNGTIGNYLKGRIYSFKIWDNGVLVRDYIPVRKGTVGYLYDRVSGKRFGNAGTGDFVVGQDVVPVEYLQSSGTQWIDTGVVPAANDTYTVETRKNNTSQDCASFGLAGCVYCFSNGRGLTGYGTYWGHIALGQGGIAGVNPLGDTNWHTIVASPTSVSVDGLPLGNRAGDAQSPLSTVKLFARGNNSASGGVAKQYNGMISHAFVNRGGSDLRKFYSVRVGTEGAMMDTLTRRIYRNAGTGAFTYGNDLKYPIPAE